MRYNKEYSWHSVKRKRKNDLQLLATELKEKIADFDNVKEDYQ